MSRESLSSTLLFVKYYYIINIISNYLYKEEIMTLRHLKIFLAVVDSGSMTKAAKNLYITQPSVSQAIAEIEEYYNIKLFERLSKKIIHNRSGGRIPFLC